MSNKNSATGLSLLEAHEQSKEVLTETSPEAVTSGELEEVVPAPTEEHPVGQNEGSENLDLFADLDADVAGEIEEQPAGDSSSFTVDGQTVPLDELRKGYLRQSDYTQKTQELAAQREAAANAVALWEALEEDYAGTMRKLQGAAFATQPASKLAEVVPPMTQPTMSVEERVQALIEADPRIAELNEIKTKQEEAAGFVMLENEFSTKIPAKSREKVLAKMDDIGVSGEVAMRTVFAALLQEAQIASAKRKNLASTSTAQGRSGETQSTKPEVQKPSSIREAHEIQKLAEKLEK